jgi:hypothetical protein
MSIVYADVTILVEKSCIHMPVEIRLVDIENNFVLLWHPEEFFGTQAEPSVAYPLGSSKRGHKNVISQRPRSPNVVVL